MIRDAQLLAGRKKIGIFAKELFNEAVSIQTIERE
jgi:hypothetical protein